jgi:hypothetical protein
MPFTYASSRLPISGSLLLAIARNVLQVAFHNQIQETLQVPRHGANNVFLVKERAGILAFDSDAGSTSMFSPYSQVTKGRPTPKKANRIWVVSEPRRH